MALRSACPLLELACFSHMLLATDRNTCRGSNADSQLGQGQDGTALAGAAQPVQVAAPAPGLSWRQAFVGEYIACGLASNGSLWCW